jgi:hypothetical protein
MGKDSTDQPLSDAHYVTVVLRLVLDQQGWLVRGEILDVESGSRKRFVNWHELAGMLRVWIREDGPDIEDPSK